MFDFIIKNIFNQSVVYCDHIFLCRIFNIDIIYVNRSDNFLINQQYIVFETY